MFSVFGMVPSKARLVMHRIMCSASSYAGVRTSCSDYCMPWRQRTGLLVRVSAPYSTASSQSRPGMLAPKRSSAAVSAAVRAGAYRSCSAAERTPCRYDVDGRLLDTCARARVSSGAAALSGKTPHTLDTMLSLACQW